MENTRTISCIIPAHNEEATIGHTLEVCVSVKELHEIIVVNDASADKTREIAGSFPGVRVLTNEHNMGKSKSVARGITEATGEFTLFLDADLAGLNAENIKSLIKPIKENAADVVISMRGNTPLWMKKVGLDFMSGERVFPRSFLMKHIKELMELKNFALEVFLNRLIISNHLRIKSVMMANVHNIRKWNKEPFWKGIEGEALMFVDIFRLISPAEFVRQNIQMRKLLVKL